MYKDDYNFFPLNGLKQAIFSIFYDEEEEDLS